MYKTHYVVKRSKRKSISLEVTSSYSVLVRAPKSMSDYRIRTFIENHEKWVLKRLSEKRKQEDELRRYSFSKDEIVEYKSVVEKRIIERVGVRSKELVVKYNKVRISNAKKRWGSCSGKRTISINWRLVFAPQKTLDYVVVHELLHLKHMNHSKKYWKAVEKVIPKYKKHKKWLKDHEYILRIE